MSVNGHRSGVQEGFSMPGLQQMQERETGEVQPSYEN